MMLEASFYTNQSEPNFLNRIIQCLDRCVSFSWSVSFIKKAGLILLLPHLEKTLSRGAKGKILTSTYQNISDIASLETFLELQRRYEYSSFILDMDAFLVTPIEGNLTIEKGIHSDEKWINKEEGEFLSGVQPIKIPSKIRDLMQI